jgi:Fur family peroxide stress response transcriptional regulator
MAVYESLRQTKTHPTAEELFHLVKPTTDKLSLATVYNALDALCNAGLVRRMPMSNGCCRYDADTSLHVHVRFRDSCEIEDVPQELNDRFLDLLPQDVLARIADSLDANIEGVSVQLIATHNPPRE